MVSDRLSDGKRIAELLASELDGLGDALADVAITDADRDVEPTPEGAFAYRVRFERDEGTELATVFIQEDRARVEFCVAPDVAAEQGRKEGLRVRPKAVHPPRTLVFVEDGAEVKRAVAVFEAVVAAS